MTCAIPEMGESTPLWKGCCGIAGAVGRSDSPSRKRGDDRLSPKYRAASHHANMRGGEQQTGPDTEI